jgi:hypothetical protein
MVGRTSLCLAVLHPSGRRIRCPRLPATRFLLGALVALVLTTSGVASAQTTKKAAAKSVEPVPSSAEMPPPVVTGPQNVTAPPETEPLAGSLAASPTRAPNVSYGVAARLRWVSIPAWMLNLFTKKNVPLSSYSVAAEFFRRKGEFDFIVSIGYMSLSPPDGNWLGRGHDASVDTDYVQFKGLGLAGIDASFVWHTFFNDWVGMHYGAGLGIGLVTGQLLRTSNGTGCTEANAGDFTKCHPIGAVCPPSGCTDASLAALGPGPDDPANPHRFVDGNVPPALPIVNVLVGVDFRLPQVRGWEAKIEGGFSDAFFLGGGVGYTF